MATAPPGTSPSGTTASRSSRPSPWSMSRTGDHDGDERLAHRLFYPVWDLRAYWARSLGRQLPNGIERSLGGLIRKEEAVLAQLPKEGLDWHEPVLPKNDYQQGRAPGERRE